MGKRKTEVRAEAVEVDAAAIRAAQACQAKQDVRYYLNGILLSKSGAVVGTNGHVLAVTRTGKSLFRSDRIVKIKGLIPAAAKTVTFYEQGMYCRTDNDKLFAFEFIDGKFPDWEKVIPNTDREEYSNGFGVNPRYIALAGKVFNRGAQMLCFPGSATTPALFTHESTSLVIMPMRVHYEFQKLVIPKAPAKKAAARKQPARKAA